MAHIDVPCLVRRAPLWKRAGVLAPFILAILSIGAADVTETPRLLVLDLDATNMPDAEVRAVDALVGANASVDGVALVTQTDLRRLTELEVAAQEMGCETSSCLAEIAGALGARYVLFGSTSRLGQSITVSLSIFDATTSVTSRDALTVTSLDALAEKLPARVQALVKAARGPLSPDAAVDVTVLQPGDGPSPLFIGGVVTTIVGALGVVGGGAVAALAEFLVVQDKDASGADKSDGQARGIIGLIGAGAGVVVTAIGVTLLMIGSGE